MYKSKSILFADFLEKNHCKNLPAIIDYMYMYLPAKRCDSLITNTPLFGTHSCWY